MNKEQEDQKLMGEKAAEKGVPRPYEIIKPIITRCWLIWRPRLPAE